MNKNFASRISAACRKGFAPVAVAGAAIAASPAAFAAYDITAATSSLADAGTAAGTIIAGAIGFAALVLGGLALYRFIRRV